MASPPSTTTSAALEEWEKFIDDETKTPYYYNSRTGETSWEVPEGFTEPTAATTSEGEPAKPPKWKRFLDKDTRKQYYYDEANDITQWDEPEGDVEDGSESEEDEDESEEEDSHESAEQSPTRDDLSAGEGSASESVTKPKANWVKHIDRSTGKPYYHDTVSNTTQWEQPEHYTGAVTPTPVSVEYLEYLHRSRAEKLAQATQRALDPQGNLSRLNALLSKIDNKGASAVPVDDAGTEDVKELVATVQERSKAEWQQHVDPQSHKYYYHNIVTGETQWQKPDAPIASALADWIPPETTEDTTSQKPPRMVSGQHYAATAKFNRLTGKFEKLGGEDYWQARGVAADREGRQMSHFFDISQLEKNRHDAQRIKEELKRKNVDWKRVAAEKKAKKQKRKNEWIYND